jgi:hypothetical protein
MLEGFNALNGNDLCTIQCHLWLSDGYFLIRPDALSSFKLKIFSTMFIIPMSSVHVYNEVEVVGICIRWRTPSGEPLAIKRMGVSEMA